MSQPYTYLRGTVLVTGGAGFIGSALVRGLISQTEVQAVTVDKLTYSGNRASLPQSHPRHRLEVVDICDGPALRRLFAQYQPAAVINLAAETHVDRSIDGPAEFIQTNVIGTFTLLQEALRHQRQLSADKARHFRFLHISTDEVFGSLGDSGAFSETTAYAPNSPYSASKASSDHLVRAWRETYGLPTIVTNCSNNYGPCQFPEKLIPMMILRGLQGRSLPLYGDGLNVRDWLYVDDHARALMLVLAQGVIGQTYNIGGNNERTNREVVHAVCDLLDRLSPSARRASPQADPACHRPAGARPPLRHRWLQDRPRARLDAAGDVRVRDGRHRRAGTCRTGAGGRTSSIGATTRNVSGSPVPGRNCHWFPSPAPPDSPVLICRVSPRAEDDDSPS